MLMEIQELKALIKESLREVLREERLLLSQALIPYVSEKEQDELDIMFGSPSDYENQESVDMTDYVKHNYKERKLIELREKIAEGTQQLRQGKVVDGEVVFQQLQEKLETKALFE